jgi:Flp pilus assembly pilin Flp
MRRVMLDRQGVAAAEFALIAGVLLTLLIGAYDIGGAIQQNIRLAAAVRAGGQYAVSFPNRLMSADGCSPTSGDSPAAPTSAACAIRQALPASWTDVTISISCSCRERGDDDMTRVSSCGSTGNCPGGSGERFVTLQASRAFSSILPSAVFNVAPLTSNSVQYEVRVQ